MKQYSLVSIITLNYNKSSYTIDCVQSILKSDYENFIVIIVDNGSEEDDYNALFSLKDERVKIERIDNNRGYVGGINYGLEKAVQYSPDYFLILNNDTLIDNIAISKLTKTANKYQNNCIVSGKVYNMDEPNTLQYIGQTCENKQTFNYAPYIKNSKEIDTGQYDREIEMGMLDDIFWLLPKNVFDKVGYYSKYFFLYGEQNDYALRAVKLGVKLIYTPNAKIWHYHHLTTGGSEKALRRIYYWQAYAVNLLAFLHLSRWEFFVFYIKKASTLLFWGVLYLVSLKCAKCKQNYMPKFYGFIYFSAWIFHKKENNGFNPYT